VRHAISKRYCLIPPSFHPTGFLDAWKEVVDPAEPAETFQLLESNLNEAAARSGGLHLTIPMAYLEAERV
jgi:hypothetical protein